MILYNQWLVKQTAVAKPTSCGETINPGALWFLVEFLVIYFLMTWLKRTCCFKRWTLCLLPMINFWFDCCKESRDLDNMHPVFLEDYHSDCWWWRLLLDDDDDDDDDDCLRPPCWKTLVADTEWTHTTTVWPFCVGTKRAKRSEDIVNLFCFV